MDFVTFGIILDNIVFSDGRIARDVLGGGGVQTAFGMRLWSDAQRVGLVANVGVDLPESVWDWLRASGVDGLGVRVSKLPTLRAWEYLDAAGRRTHLWAAPAEVVEAQLQRSLVYVPEAYHRARGFHLGLHPDSPDLTFLADLRALGGLVSVEPFKPADQRPTPEALRALLSAADVFSPNLNGARSLVGPGKPPELTQRLIDSGARVVALRMGAQGSLVSDAEGGRSAHIPAFPVNVQNPVGAGNAYCGGFLTGWVETHDVVEAGLRGAVAASFLLEQVGVPIVSEAVRAEARRRLEMLSITPRICTPPHAL